MLMCCSPVEIQVRIWPTNTDYQLNRVLRTTAFQAEELQGPLWMGDELEYGGMLPMVEH